jgi:hypothetical protein
VTEPHISEKRKINIFREGLDSPNHVDPAREIRFSAQAIFVLPGARYGDRCERIAPVGQSSGGGRGSAAAQVGWKPPVSFTRHRNPAPRIVGHVRLRFPRPSIKGLLAGHA